ncbi:MAG: PEP-CTERM sorting domain-containing protein [Planctomycetaceae bacterium]|nr:PEP-CTERM sorting domain-containing protein [Planctomycetaceae bacterium]
MKVKFFVMLAVICSIGLISVAKADTIGVGASAGAWGTVFSDVEKEAYRYKYGIDSGTVSNYMNYNDTTTVTYNGNKANLVRQLNRTVKSGGDTVDTWEYRQFLMEAYLTYQLKNNEMTAKKDVTGILNSSEYSLVTIPSGTGLWESKNAIGNIYGKQAELLKGDLVTSGVADQLSRNGVLTLGEVLSSSASPVDESVDHNWVYKPSADTFTSNSTSTSNGVGDHNTGIFAFVTSFDYKPNDVYQYLNGWFSELGDLLGIYINGFKLTDEYLTLSSDYLASALFGSYDMELDLEKLFNDGILTKGNNNLAFVLDAIQPAFSGGNYYDQNDGLVAFTSGLNQNTESIFVTSPPPPPNTTPEPATLLILGAGLVGLAIRKRLANKKTA